MIDHCADQSNVEVIKVNFGRVSSGRIVKKTVKLTNKSCMKQCYKVRRDRGTNPLDRVFDIEIDTWILLPDGFIECKINYHPVVPARCNIDYFSILNCDRICYTICVKGTCIGPNVVPSLSRLVMMCPKEGGEIKKRLQLRNLSDVTAIFNFDIDQINSPFKLDVIAGTISPNNHVNVTINFFPRREGLYVCYLPCLILHQGPLVTELFGYRGSAFSKADEFTPLIFPKPRPLIGGFEGYMSDAVRIMKGVYPPISISDNYIDFGYGEFDTDKIFQSLPKSLCITNHSDIDLTVKWDKDIKNVFNVNPCDAIIRGQRSALFEFHFCPDKQDALFSMELLAHAFWETEIPETVPIPLVASVRTIGHSFSPGSAGWIPQYEVPRIVILPPCIPSSPVYTNFIMKLLGHLPITFRFIPPKIISCFSVKPMVGIIYRDHHLVTVQFFPDSGEEEFVYSEQWTIQFNGNSRYEVPIIFKGSAEHPKIIIGDEFEVKFSPVHPECEEITQVKIKNVTRHCIEYSFPDLPPEIKMEKDKGIILANEILSHNWIFHPKEIGDHRYNVRCCITALEGGYHNLGNSIDMQIEVNGRVERGYLVALPDELNFGIVPYGKTKSLSFHFFNFSSIKIHFKLICKERSLPIGNIRRDVEVRPINQTVFPGSNVKIDVDLTPREPGFYQLMVQYLLRTNSSANETLSKFEPKDICVLNCMCILPGFEIKDLLYLTNRELHLSKASLWNLMAIDEFNAIAKSVLPGRKKEVRLRFPELVLSQETLVIKLLIVNSSPVPSTWNLKRVKKCDCKQVIKNRGFSFKYKEYNCDHRLACTFFPNEGTLQPQGRDIVTVKICYLLLGETILQWELKLSDNRIVVVNANVVALSEVEARPSILVDSVLALEKTYIGDMDAVNQMCWIYNSTDKEVEYSLDICPLQNINIENLNEIFICKNSSGVLNPHSRRPIIFKFQPRRLKAYEVTLPLKLGDKLTSLSIKAEADILCKTKFLTIGKAPNVDQFSITELPVSFSSDRIVVSSMPVHSEVNRMITIFNESKNEVVGYRWESYEVPNVIEVKATPSSGRIQPNKSHTFCITIKSHSEPSKIVDLSLSCQFLDLSGQRAYEKSIIAYNSLCEELVGQFIITEKGIEEPKPWLKLLDEPKPFYKSLSISCYIYSLIDTDLKITVDEIFKSLPPTEVKIDNNESCEETQPKLINIASFILEGMIWEILNSNPFVNTLKENLKTAENSRYSQYQIRPTERQRLRNRSYNLAPRQLLASVFEQMIFGIVHEEFGLSMYHFNAPEDIRQFHYQKRDPQLSRQYNLYNKFNSKETGNKISDSTERKMESQVKFNVEYDDLSNDSSYD